MVVRNATLNQPSPNYSMGMEGFIWLTTDAQLERLVDGRDRLEPVCYGAYRNGGEQLLDLGKSYGGIHFLLTGASNGGNPPLDFVLGGGRAILDGNILARAFPSEFLPGLACALESLRREDIVRRFDGPEMDRIRVHPGRWSASGGGTAAYLADQIERVRAHVQAGVRLGLGMLVWLE